MSSLPPIVRSRLVLISLAILFILPLALAWFLYFYGTAWQPQARTHHGVLIAPARPLPLDQIQLYTIPELSPFPLSQLRGRWTLLTIAEHGCSQRCWESLYKMRQTKVLLNKNSERVQKVLITLQAEELIDLEKIQQAYPETWILGGGELNQLTAVLEANEPNRIFLIDPLGNFLMYYPKTADPEGLFKDLKHLLKLSQIG